MRRTLRTTIALALLALVAALATSPHVNARPALQDPSCTVTVDKTASPSDIVLGQTVTVTLQVTGSCPEQEHPADVVLAIDRSRSMSSNNKLAAAKDAASLFVNRMDPALVRIGVVAISREAKLVQPLTNDRGTLVTAIQNVQTESGTNIVDGFDMSRMELTGGNARAGARKVIVLLTDGKHSVSNPPISDLPGVDAAVRAAGIEVFSIGLGSDADEAVLRSIATDAAHYFYSPANADLEGIYVQIAGRTQAPVLFQSSAVTDVLPGNMMYLPATASPVQPVLDPASRTLRWSLNSVATPGYTLSYQVRPTQTGTWPTNVRAQLDYTDGLGNVGSIAFPVPNVRVTAPQPTGPSCVCQRMRAQMPPAVVADAMANPEHYYGWRMPLDRNKPPSPANPPRECLALTNPNLAYHPLYNAPQWRVGCP